MFYRERQKLSERKVLQLTGFHSKLGKTFMVLLHVYIESAEASHCLKKINWKKFRVSSMIRKNHETLA